MSRTRLKKEQERVRRRLILGYAAIILGTGCSAGAVLIIISILIKRVF